MSNNIDVEGNEEAWYEPEDCEMCCEDEDYEYEKSFTWENDSWTCDGCGGVQ